MPNNVSYRAQRAIAPFSLTVLLLTLFISGCGLAPNQSQVDDDVSESEGLGLDNAIAGSTQTAAETISYVFAQDTANRYSKQELTELNSSALYAKVGDNPSTTLVLGVTEQHNGVSLQQWYTANEALIVRNGRLIRSEGLPQNIRYTANTQADPLGCWLNQTPSAKITPEQRPCATRWHSQQDIELASGRVVRLSTVSQFRWGTPTTINTPLRGAQAVQHLIETVTTDAGHQWQNQYWFQPQNKPYGVGHVVKTEQQLALGHSAVSGTLTLEEARY